MPSKRSARLYAAMLKYLRIALTALSLTACVLLIALWVRSYWWADAIARGTTGNRIVTVIASNYGRVVVGRGAEPASSSFQLGITDRWGHFSDNARPTDATLAGKPIAARFEFSFQLGCRRYSLLLSRSLPGFVGALASALYLSPRRWLPLGRG